MCVLALSLILVNADQQMKSPIYKCLKDPHQTPHLQVTTPKNTEDYLPSS